MSRRFRFLDDSGFVYLNFVMPLCFASGHQPYNIYKYATILINIIFEERENYFCRQASALTAAGKPSRLAYA